MFQKAYHYNSWRIGLCYILVGGGLITGSIVSGRYSDYVLKRLYKIRGKENVHPEMRLRAVFPSFVLIPVGLLVYGWTIEKKVGVHGPFIGLFLLACGQMFGNTPASVYLVDSKPGRSARVLSINNFVRYITASIVAVFSTSSIRALGTGVLFSILAGVSVINMAILLSVLTYGKKWRTNFENRTGTGPLTKE